ncbi:MAG: CD225/dispanin family protein [Muribaculaceae bacterium]|nr:CD225/dispanin family protein [Muribaculaceae bacterium]
MDNNTPPPNPDEEWAKKLKLKFDPEQARQAQEKAEEQPQTPPPPAFPPYPPQPGMDNGQPQYTQPANSPEEPSFMKQPSQPMYEREQEEMPPTYLLWSVLALIFCCMPTAIVAIIYSAQVSSKFYNKDYAGAKRASERAQMWIIASIVIGVVSMAVYLPLSLLNP